MKPYHLKKNESIHLTFALSEELRKLALSYKGIIPPSCHYSGTVKMILRLCEAILQEKEYKAEIVVVEQKTSKDKTILGVVANKEIEISHEP